MITYIEHILAVQRSGKCFKIRKILLETVLGFYHFKYSFTSQLIKVGNIDHSNFMPFEHLFLPSHDVLNEGHWAFIVRWKVKLPLLGQDVIDVQFAFHHRLELTLFDGDFIIFAHELSSEAASRLVLFIYSWVVISKTEVGSTL